MPVILTYTGTADYWPKVLLYLYFRLRMTPCSFELRTYWRGRKQAVPSKLLRAHHTCGDPACSALTHLDAVPPPRHYEAHRYRDLPGGFDETAAF